MVANIRTGHYTLQEMVESLGYWKLCPCWVHCLLVKYELQQENVSSQLLKQYVLEGLLSLHHDKWQKMVSSLCIMTSGKRWCHHFDLAERQQSIE